MLIICVCLGVVIPFLSLQRFVFYHRKQHTQNTGYNTLNKLEHMLINYNEEYFVGGDVEMIINILTAVKMSTFCTKKYLSSFQPVFMALTILFNLIYYD